LDATHLAQDLLGQAGRVDIGGVDQVDPRVQAHVHLAPGLVDIGRTDVRETASPAERHRAHREYRNPQS
jgi:hypothetical protein